MTANKMVKVRSVAMILIAMRSRSWDGRCLASGVLMPLVARNA